MSALAALAGFLGVTIALVLGLLAVGRALRVRARTQSPLQAQPYECGEEPVGLAWMQFNARYYLVALFFVLFDLEAVFLFPWATASRALGPGGLVAVVGFALILLLGWVYGLRKDALKWQ